ncbi:hypothetical protein QUB60_04245 [Microcoleus sp. A2-C5]|uniref:hypothetical protein n=1 Tax=Microcoleaceae TaxID=1892252 RepID=UPI00223891BD|nr:hypothetical protein [Lyngbya sp. CCAP 1446/10]MCW6048935.1 hypothetical protein [Lyngbya sp. CCAP 1446/10]
MSVFCVKKFFLSKHLHPQVLANQHWRWQYFNRFDRLLEYLLADLPKTAGSMKMGIDRIRDIMQSLRNYSRTDTLHKRAVDIGESLVMGHWSLVSKIA